MNRLTLSVRNVRRTPLRTLLTAAGMAAAVLAFCFVQTIIVSWESKGQGAGAESLTRLVSRHRMSLKLDMPLRYVERIGALPGVGTVSHGRWFGARVPTSLTEPFRSYIVDGRTWFDVFDNVDLPRPALEEWLRTPDGIVVGELVAKKFNWKVGDRVKLTSGKFKPANASVWDVVVVAIYKAKTNDVDREVVYAHYKLINENLSPVGKNRTEWVVFRSPPGKPSATMAHEVDEMFSSDTEPTLTQDERTFTAAFFGAADAILSGLSIVSAILLGIVLLLLGNSVFVGAAERTGEYAVLKALGFPRSSVAGGVLFEALLVGLGGGLAGTLLAAGLINGVVGPGVEEHAAAVFPVFRLPGRLAAVAVAVSLAISIVAAVIPVLRVWRLRVVDALRRV